MEKLSRVKKYQELRNEIESSQDEKIEGNKLEEYANRLNEIDPEVFEKAEPVQTTVHAPAREKEITVTTEIDDTDNFRNEYLDDFINEVREYNIQKGIRSDNDTQLNILNQINATNRMKRMEYVEELEEEKQSEPLFQENTIS